MLKEISLSCHSTKNSLESMRNFILWKAKNSETTEILNAVLLLTMICLGISWWEKNRIRFTAMFVSESEVNGYSYVYLKKLTMNVKPFVCTKVSVSICMISDWFPGVGVMVIFIITRCVSYVSYWQISYSSI